MTKKTHDVKTEAESVIRKIKQTGVDPLAAAHLCAKLGRVREGMKMRAFGRTATAILAAIPHDLIEQLTVTQLVSVANALHAAHQAGRAAAEHDILAEGAIYDPRVQRMREVAA